MARNREQRCGQVCVNVREWGMIADEVRGYAKQFITHMKGLDANGKNALRAWMGVDASMLHIHENLDQFTEALKYSRDNTGSRVDVRDWGLVVGEFLALSQCAYVNRMRLEEIPVLKNGHLTYDLVHIMEEMAEGLSDLASDIDTHIIQGAQ